MTFTGCNTNSNQWSEIVLGDKKYLGRITTTCRLLDSLHLSRNYSVFDNQALEVKRIIWGSGVVNSKTRNDTKAEMLEGEYTYEIAVTNLPEVLKKIFTLKSTLYKI